jgi:hypothetical protein
MIYPYKTPQGEISYSKKCKKFVMARSMPFLGNYASILWYK